MTDDAMTGPSASDSRLPLPGTPGGNASGVQARLQRERDEAAEQLTALAQAMEALRTVREASPDDDEHDPEGPTLSSEWSQLRGLEIAAVARLADADAAFERLEQGRYGVCLSCGRPIAPGRLEVRPAAALCVECAARAS